MRLTDEQVAGLLKCRQEHLTKLSPIVKERWQIYRSQLASFRPILEEEPSSSDLNLNYRQVHPLSQILPRPHNQRYAAQASSQISALMYQQWTEVHPSICRACTKCQYYILYTSSKKWQRTCRHKTLFKRFRATSGRSRP